MSFLPQLPSLSMLRLAASAVCLLALSEPSVLASPVTFTGEDLNAGPGSAHPNSSLAAANFAAAAAAIGTVSSISFESAPLGSFTSLAAAPGVTITGAADQGAKLSVLNVPSYAPNPALGGFNTTPGGSQYVSIAGGTLIFTFATPTQFFGAYLSGIQTNFYQDTISFSDGTSQTINVPGVGTTDSNGALDFVGFTDAGQSISSITITAGNANAGADYIGIDDVQYQSTAVATTPEPGSLILVGTGLLGALGAARRRFNRS